MKIIIIIITFSVIFASSLAPAADENKSSPMDLLFSKAAKHTLMKEYDSAIQAYTAAIAIDPEYAKAYRNRGLVYMENGAYSTAIKDLEKAISLTPRDEASFSTSCYTSRAFCYMQMGLYEKAINDYNAAINLRKELAELLVLLR
jgi:tetratricopeptide (TPR) repeat protein